MALSVPEDDASRLRIALGKIARTVDRQVSGGGLTRSQMSVLATTFRLGPVGVSELADIEGLNPTMLSRMIGKLEEAGLIVRSSDPADRRAVVVAVTETGSALQQRLRTERTALFVEQLQALPEPLADQLLAALPALEALADQMRSGLSGQRP